MKLLCSCYFFNEQCIALNYAGFILLSEREGFLRDMFSYKQEFGDTYYA